jgi:hypothetical protein
LDLKPVDVSGQLPKAKQLWHSAQAWAWDFSHLPVLMGSPKCGHLLLANWFFAALFAQNCTKSSGEAARLASISNVHFVGYFARGSDAKTVLG